MFLFLKLVLAHLVADFILQFDELFKLKLRSLTGHVLHALCHVILSLLFAWPYLGDPTLWLFIWIIGAIHLFQDLLKYRLMANKRLYFRLFVGDQILHLILLATVLLLPISGKVLGFPNHPTLHHLYIHDQWTAHAIIYLTATVPGNFLFHAFRTSFIPDSRLDQCITTPEILHGMLERMIITTVFLFYSNPLALLVSPLAGCLRFPFPLMKNEIDFLLSFIYGALSGLLFRLWF